ncbi:MAG: DNA polymerase IV [bacterium]|nr:DNA polymerase IV [bacterium]
MLYATVPGFYAEAERAAQPGLRDRPIVVGGDPRKRGLVQAATPDALAAGIALGMPMIEALGRCPNAKALRTHMREYREVAKRLQAVFRRQTERVEAAGLDAAYLDLGGSDEPLERVAVRLQKEVADELGLPLRVGAAPIKFVARLASEEADDAGFFWVRPEGLRSFLDALRVTRLPGVGPRTAERMASQGVATVGQLRRMSPAAVEASLGAHGLGIHAYAMGRDESRLRVAPHPRSVSQESTFETPELDRGVLEERLGELAVDLERSLALERLAAKRVVLKLRYDDGEGTTRSRTLKRPLSTTAEISELASELLGHTQLGRPVKRVGIAVSQIVRIRHDDRQLELF